MPTLLSTVLVLFVSLGAPLPQAAPADDGAQFARPLAQADALDFLLALHAPGPGSVSIDVIEIDDMLIATITRVFHVPGTEKVVMFRTTYVFPSTIYAHSAVTVGFNAFEMD